MDMGAPPMALRCGCDDSRAAVLEIRSARSVTDKMKPASIQYVADHAVGELRLEPGGFRRHDRAGVGDRHQVVHLRRVERESRRHLAGCDQPLEFGKAAAAA